jgi:DNA-binding MarR family transcriptional regulator
MADTSPRLENLLASLTLGLHDDTTASLEEATGLTGSGPAAVLALDEFLGGANVRRLADVLGLTHSGAVRLVAQLDRAGLAERRTGPDRRTIEVRLTAAGRRRARRARAARATVLRHALTDLDADEAASLEHLLERVVAARVRARIERRAEGHAGPWWCRTCDFSACGRPAGHCPAQIAARRA